MTRTVEIPTPAQPLALRMNPTVNGRRCDGTREAIFVLADLVDLETQDWVYDLLDSDGSIWRASVSIWSDKLWLLVDETGSRYWVEQPYPDTGESWR
jgi:hypothetical protein